MVGSIWRLSCLALLSCCVIVDCMAMPHNAPDDSSSLASGTPSTGPPAHRTYVQPTPVDSWWCSQSCVVRPSRRAPIRVLAHITNQKERICSKIAQASELYREQRHPDESMRLAVQEFREILFQQLPAANQTVDEKLSRLQSCTWWAAELIRRMLTEDSDLTRNDQNNGEVFKAILESIETDLADMNCFIIRVRQVQDVATCNSGIPADLIEQLDFQQSSQTSVTAKISRTFWLMNELGSMFDEVSGIHTVRRPSRRSNGEQHRSRVR